MRKDNPTCLSCGEHMTKKEERGGAIRYKCKCGASDISIPIEPITMTGYDVIEPTQVLVREFDGPVNIHGFTDIHHGANEHDMELFDKAVEMVKNDPNAYWFGNGDMIESIPSNYKISQRGQCIENEDQVLTIGDKLSQISEKCLFVRPGNHESRFLNLVSLDVVTLIAARLGVPMYRLPGYMVIKVKDKVWKIASAHGKSGAKNGDLDLNKLREIYSEADIFYVGHDHKLYAKEMPSLGVDIERKKEILIHQWYVRGGSFLRYADYARYSLYGIQKCGHVEIKLTEDSVNCIVHQ